MVNTAMVEERRALVRQAFFLEYVTLAWMTIEAGVAIVSGIAAHSITLLAFGIVPVGNRDIGGDMAREHVKGAVNKVKGAIKRTVGRVTGNKKMQAEGTLDRAKGTVQNAAGDAKDRARSATR